MLAITPCTPDRSNSIDAAFVARILVYSAWHAVLGALLGVGVVLAVALGLLLLSLFAA